MKNNFLAIVKYVKYNKHIHKTSIPKRMAQKNSLKKETLFGYTYMPFNTRQYLRKPQIPEDLPNDKRIGGSSNDYH